MSHIDRMDLVVEDLTALEEAVKFLGGTLKRDQESFRHWGSRSGQALRGGSLDGQTEGALGTCRHAISFPNADYEIGVVARKDKGFDLQFDAYDLALSAAVGGARAPRLKAEYGVARARREARRRGHKIRGVERKDGKIRLMVSV